jgi:hypothetical protein
MIKLVDWTLPIRTVSEANRGSEHWTKTRLRKKKQSQAVWAQWKSVNPPVSVPCKIVFTRIAPRTLDDDNNVSAFKTIRDEVSGLINPGHARGRADNGGGMIWEYRQEKGKPKEYAIRIEIYMEGEWNKET